MGLQQYRQKRDFSRTSEPRGKTAVKQSRLTYVVQKHAASHLHYDFRLEFGGVLKSWAVPKGPDLNPANKRLAMQVEDHPVEYGQFEGTIPQGQYGGGTVMLWDHGTWEPLEDPRTGLREGHLKFELRGEKLRGRWMLVRRGGKKGGAEERHWFLFKERDEFADTTHSITDSAPLSVKTQRDLDEIAGGKAGARPRTKHKSRMKLSAERAASKTSRNGEDSVAGVRLSHPDKVLYPEQGITKLDLAEYYKAIADWVLPEVKNRPLALVRCPAGRGKPCFFQKHPGEGAPKHLAPINISQTKSPEYHMAITDLAGVIELVQMGVLEIHTWGSHARTLERPDRLVFDLDPDPSVDWQHVITAAREVKLVLEELGLVPFLKTTGGKGLHIVVPIRPRTEWDEAKAFCKAVAELCVRGAPDRYVSTMSKAARRGKIFIDYLRNGRGATFVAPYSTRSRPGAPVSVPVSWNELNDNLRSDTFTVTNVRQRLAKLKKDPWADLDSSKRSITKAMFRALQV